MQKNKFLQRYESLIDSYFRMVESLDPARLYIQNDSWSFIQFFDHLYRVHFEFQQSVETYASKRFHLGIKSHFNYMKLFLTFHLPLKFKIPRQVKNIAPQNEDSLSNLKEKIRELINSTAMVLNQLEQADFKKSFFKHPIFSFLNPNHSLAFLFYHAKHHRKQLRRLIKQNR